LSFISRLACLTAAIAIVFLTGCSNDQPVKAQSDTKSVKYTNTDEFSQSMKLTQAKALPAPKIDMTTIQQKQALEAMKMQHETSFYRGSRYKKQVALTFDDGPDDNYTKQVLDILKKEHVKATFFVVGTMAKRYPSSLKRIDQEGHVVANHSWNHPVLSKLPEAGVMKQIEDTNNVITSVIGKTPLLVRPPYGALNKKLTNAVGKKGYKLIYWDVDTLDWDNHSPDQILASVKKESKTGSIVLQHSAGSKSIQSTVIALPKIIAFLRSQGYQFVTIDEMLSIPAYSKKPVLDPKKPVVKMKKTSEKKSSPPSKHHKDQKPPSDQKKEDAVGSDNTQITPIH
jgi:peptidoglycan/xylan/chitin deacetylase (PgdA/CDA1 family)